MRYLKNVIMGIALFATTILMFNLAFAEKGHGAYKGGEGHKEACVAQIKVLRDSAAALQASNPALAKGLNNLADKKEEMMKKQQEWKAKHDAKMKLLKDSAMALQTSNPALSQELQKMSEKKHMEKEEAGENTESMEEQGEAK